MLSQLPFHCGPAGQTSFRSTPWVMGERVGGSVLSQHSLQGNIPRPGHKENGSILSPYQKDHMML